MVLARPDIRSIMRAALHKTRYIYQIFNIAELRCHVMCHMIYLYITGRSDYWRNYRQAFTKKLHPTNYGSRSSRHIAELRCHAICHIIYVYIRGRSDYWRNSCQDILPKLHPTNYGHGRHCVTFHSLAEAILHGSDIWLKIMCVIKHAKCYYYAKFQLDILNIKDFLIYTYASYKAQVRAPVRTSGKCAGWCPSHYI